MTVKFKENVEFKEKVGGRDEEGSGGGYEGQEGGGGGWGCVITASRHKQPNCVFSR